MGGAVTEPRIGAYLAGQRKLRGISRQELAELTRIPIRSLERLEAGLFDNVDDGFVRGFVRTVSMALGLDPEDTLTRMLPEPVGPNESPIFRHLALGRVLLMAGALVALVALAGGVSILSAVIRPPLERQVQEPHGLRRRDPVRALAQAQGAVGASAEVVLASSPIEPLPVDTTLADSASASAVLAASASAAGEGAEPSRAAPSGQPALPAASRDRGAPSEND